MARDWEGYGRVSLRELAKETKSRQKKEARLALDYAVAATSIKTILRNVAYAESNRVEEDLAAARTCIERDFPKELRDSPEFRGRYESVVERYNNVASLLKNRYDIKISPLELDC